jgi:nucleotide-binding universal stress UspA family protein
VSSRQVEALSAYNAGSSLGGSAVLTMRNVLVAVDFSDTSSDAVRYAHEVAKSFEATIHLLHVVPDPLQQPWAVEAPGLDFPGLADQWRVEAQERLTALAADANIEPAGSALTVLAGVPHRVIAEYATTHAIDLIVLGSHGHSPVVHFLLGSVTERVVRQAVCPVLVVPHRTIRSKRNDPVSASSHAGS